MVTIKQIYRKKKQLGIWQPDIRKFSIRCNPYHIADEVVTYVFFGKVRFGELNSILSIIVFYTN
jgi:hypothetical protein